MTTMSKITDFLIKYKLVIIPLVPLLFIIIVITLVFYPQSGNQQFQPTPTPPTDIITNPTQIINPDTSSINEHREIFNPGDVQGLQKTESLSDGTTKYTMQSQNVERSNLVITDKTGYSIFTRTVASPESNLRLSGFVDLYGKTKWVFKGSKFYGPDTQIHVYDNLGLALIVNAQTSNVLEQYLFEPMFIDDYIKKHGEDIQDPTPEL